MKCTEIAELARVAGRDGKTWNDFTFGDAVQDYCETVGLAQRDLDIESWQRAYEQGCSEANLANGWVYLWTTAPSDYDTFGTTTVEVCGDWRGKTLRKVLAHPHHVGYQSGRYGSGLHGAWDVDPGIEEREATERIERNRLAREREASARLVGLAWLHALTESQLQTAIESEDLEEHGITYKDARDWRDQRVKARQTAEQAAEWERCRASFADGAILADAGSPSERGVYGPIPGREPHVYYDCKVTNDWRKAVDEATVDARGELVGSLAYVADWITSGRLRVVPVDSVPPAKVTERIGQGRSILKVDVKGRTVWVGWPRFASEPLILDANGRIVRAKAVCEAAITVWRSTPGY